MYLLNCGLILIFFNDFDVEFFIDLEVWLGIVFGFIFCVLGIGLFFLKILIFFFLYVIGITVMDFTIFLLIE